MTRSQAGWPAGGGDGAYRTSPARLVLDASDSGGGATTRGRAGRDRSSSSPASRDDLCHERGGGLVRAPQQEQLLQVKLDALPQAVQQGAGGGLEVQHRRPGVHHGRRPGQLSRGVCSGCHAPRQRLQRQRGEGWMADRHDLGAF